MFLFSFCAGAVPVSLLQFCVLVYSFWLRMRSDKCGNQMTMLFNLSRCCKLYSFKKTLKCCFRNWSLRAEDFFFLSSVFERKKKKQTHPHVPTVHLDLNRSCVHRAFFSIWNLFSVACSPVLLHLFFVFYDVTLYYEVLSEWLTPICMY